MKYFVCSQLFRCDMSLMGDRVYDADVLGDQPSSLYDKEQEPRCLECSSKEEAERILEEWKLEGDNAAFIRTEE